MGMNIDYTGLSFLARVPPKMVPGGPRVHLPITQKLPRVQAIISTLAFQLPDYADFRR